MPVHVAPNDLHHIVARRIAKASICTNVAEFSRLDSLDQGAKPFCKGHLLRVTEVLAGKDQQAVRQPRIRECGE